MRKLQVTLMLAFNMISCVNLRDIMESPEKLEKLTECIENRTKVTFDLLSGEGDICPHEWLEQIRDAENPEAILLWHDGKKRNYQLVTKPEFGITASELSIPYLIKRISENYTPCHEDNESILLDSSEFGIWEKDVLRMFFRLNLLAFLFKHWQNDYDLSNTFERIPSYVFSFSSITHDDYEWFDWFYFNVFRGEFKYILENMGYKKSDDSPEQDIVNFLDAHVPKENNKYFKRNDEYFKDPSKITTYRKRFEFLKLFCDMEALNRFVDKKNEFTIRIEGYDLDYMVLDQFHLSWAEEHRELVSEYLKEHLPLWTELYP
jgi:hypothetical protein